MMLITMSPTFCLTGNVVLADMSWESLAGGARELGSIDWFDLLAVQRTLRSLLQHHSLKTSILWLGEVLGLCCCAWAFSSCSEQGLLFLAVLRLLTAWLLLWSTDSRVPKLSSCHTQA